jgi:hypothetical protein
VIYSSKIMSNLEEENPRPQAEAKEEEPWRSFDSGFLLFKLKRPTLEGESRALGENLFFYMVSSVISSS